MQCNNTSMVLPLLAAFHLCFAFNCDVSRLQNTAPIGGQVLLYFYETVKHTMGIQLTDHVVMTAQGQRY